MSRRYFAVGVAGLAALLLVACGGRSGDHAHAPEGSGHEAHEHGTEPSSAFKEGVGLSFSVETLRALGLELAEVAEAPVGARHAVSALVFQEGPPTLASASVGADVEEVVRSRRLTGACVRDVRRAAPGGAAELILELETPARAGVFVPLVLADAEPATVLAIPRSAVLRTTLGLFVYVANGGHFLRTPVKVGAISAEKAEIVEGLYAGDQVVVRAVDQLWLAELRFTKGGGHCH